MKHYANPLHKVDKDMPWEAYEYYSDACVDELHLFIKEENNVISDIKFRGVGCAIFLASTDIMLDSIINKSIEEAGLILDNYKNMIYGKDFNESSLGNLNIFKNVDKNFNRLHCAEMVSKALDKFINKK